MSEFVEESLEQLLPVFERLHTVELLNVKEVNEFIKRCRNHEYRLQKTVKDPHDFVLYAEYLRDVLELIRIRRNRLKYFNKHNEIDGSIKAKIADIYRRCTDRFQGRAEVWRKRLDYLKKENMSVRCSQAYFRALQVMGRDVELRCEAALWEFQHNNSIDNARVHLQLGLRSSPESPSLWITFFRVEILNVIRLLERKKVLSGNDSAKPEQESGAKANEAGHELPEDGERDKDEPSDAVLNLELAELVAQQALNAPEIHNKNELLFELWRVADEFGEQSKRLEVMLYEKLWTDANLCEESFIAKYEKHSNDANAFDILDESVRRFETLKMFRYYIDVCEKRISNDDVFADAKLYDVYKLMDEKNLATVDDYKKLLEFESDDEVSERIVRRALQRFGDSSFLWTYLIQLKVDNGNASKKDIQKLFNDAEHAVASENSLELYEMAIDWAISNSSKKAVDELFKRAIMKTSPQISSEIKCIRLRYLNALTPNDPTSFRDEYLKMSTSPPNSVNVHKTFIELERASKRSDSKHVVRAFENCVADFGCSQYECWIDYAKYLIDNDPLSLTSLYQRAIVCVPEDQMQSFIAEWTQLLQSGTKQSAEELSVTSETIQMKKTGSERSRKRKRHHNMKFKSPKSSLISA